MELRGIPLRGWGRLAVTLAVIAMVLPFWLPVELEWIGAASWWARLAARVERVGAAVLPHLEPAEHVDLSGAAGHCVPAARIFGREPTT